jgi:beta-lactam-binding protein with PASTA domain/tRNA A-37 threonylcarbamoyl transferase component Bud32
MQQLVDNRYRLKRPLGSGGMADVYLAHDDVLDRDVALKVMSSRYAQDEEFVERFRREAQSAAALSHPNIVSIFDRGETEDGTYYIAMEYLSGGTLKDRILKRGALPARTAAAVALQIAGALGAAHRRGVVHRDIKPHNILITDSGDLKVTDFGIARAASSSTMTKTGSILGTAHYISPEQAMGEPVGPQSDLYSLGVVLYEMLTGELPYDADTPIGIAMKHVNGHLRPPVELDPSIPAGINAITMRLLEKDPNDRYASASELAKDLERVADGLEPESAATTRHMTRVAPRRTQQTRAMPAAHREEKRRRRGILPVLLLLLIPLLALLGWGGYNLLQEQQQRAAEARMVNVPDLQGMTLDEARRQYDDRFDFNVDREVEGREEVGTIVEQDPSGGRAERGSVIEVVTVGTQVADVPDVRGQGREEAQRTLEEANFKVSVEERESSSEEEGKVLEQAPSGGESAEVGSEVKITVGTGPPTVKVPNIPYGATPEEAKVQLEDKNLELGNVTETPGNDVAEGGVVNQDPAPDTEVEEGSAVDIVISSGPEQTEVPDVTGQNIDVATQTLASYGLNSTAVEQQSNKTAGVVLSTDPGAGTLVDLGSTITLYYSSGPPEETTTPEPQPKPDPKQPDPKQPKPKKPGDGGKKGPGGGKKDPGDGFGDIFDDEDD